MSTMSIQRHGVAQAWDYAVRDISSMTLKALQAYLTAMGAVGAELVAIEGTRVFWRRPQGS